MKLLTDTEIIKSYEWCTGDTSDKCRECSFENEAFCDEVLQDAVIDLMKRQQAEIERLQKAGEEAVSCFTRMESLYKIKCKELGVAKAEAVKEFAERLLQLYTGEQITDDMHCPIGCIKENIVDVLEEMAGEKE